MYLATPPKGMRDFLPKEKAHRDRIAAKIRSAYTACGFTEIETSSIENISNLTGGDGGENQKLIYKIMKRGEKLDEALAQSPVSENDLADLGLRFDFTLPLARFYSNNRNELPGIFKSIQMGMVYRGERPQKGRYRSFVQCDVDIIGDPTPLAEIEILNAATRALDSIGLTGYEILISDRRFLIALVTASGLPLERADEVCISLDKLDKIGKDGVLKELASKNLDGTALLDNIEGITIADIAKYSPEAAENLAIITSALAHGGEGGENNGNGVTVRFEPTLVRGMGYYTATIFEIFSPKYGSALGGGGRYDRMIGKISGTDAPAAGFSIGFERICDLLGDQAITGDSRIERTAVLVEHSDKFKDALAFSRRLPEGEISSIFLKKKKFGKQLQNLENEGFTKFYDLDRGQYLETSHDKKQ
ncbi:MAG: ATP phosphoribosyltransferase regulatory subunit [Bacillota bacterium]|nr:ATP phosphoribosyltransferase regulatory subunit [Bacillota bacterium]